MFLRCACGSLFRLAKYLDPPWRAYPGDLSEGLSAWFEQHDTHDDDFYPMRPTLAYELDGALSDPSNRLEA
jgi:hypothetical protein